MHFYLYNFIIIQLYKYKSLYTHIALLISKMVEKKRRITTTISIDEDLLKEFSKIVIEKEGLRKKNDVMEKLIKQYVSKNKKG